MGTGDRHFAPDIKLNCSLSTDPMLLNVGSSDVHKWHAGSLGLLQVNNIKQQIHNRCHYCQGAGYLTCGHCVGSGIDPGNKESCPFCAGSGKVMCTGCLCTGKQMATEHDPRIDPFT